VDPADLSPTGELPATTPDETPDAAQRRRDAAFAAQRRENAALKARLAAVEARIGEAGSTKQEARSSDPNIPAPRSTLPAPSPEAFATHAAYVQAVATWAVQQHEAVKAQAATATSIQTAWESQEAQAKTKFADYDEALAADTTRYHPAVLQAIQTSEQGAEVAYHLATHPEEATRIAALAPVAALRALGKLEARLEAAATPPAVPAPTPTPTPTPKPRPLTPVGGAGIGGSTVSPDAMDYEEYSAWYKRTYGSR